MKVLKYFIPGVLFGIVMTKSEAVSWFRIQEMFRFDSFHMYGIIGTAVVFATIMTFAIKKFQGKSLDGETIRFTPKTMSIPRYLLGGIIFGLGWAMTGACPGPMFTLVGHGVWTIFLVIASATLGTYAYGALKNKLPH